MTIIESALKRVKEQAQKGPPARARRASDYMAPSDAGVPSADAPYSEVAVPKVAPQEFDPPRCRLNVEFCRQQRVLFGDGRERHELNISRAVGMLRTRLLHRVRSHKWMTIGITSACPSDGKSLTAVNLALSLAREKSHQVFLVDSDLMKPSISTYLGIEPPHQVLDFFESRIEARDLFVSIGVENFLIAGGAAHSLHSSELLATQRFEELVGFVKAVGTNPLMIIDLPPVLSTDDVLVLAPRLDAILLVVSEGQTARADVERAAKLLSEFKFAGCVLNRAKDAVAGSYYGYGAQTSE